MEEIKQLAVGWVQFPNGIVKMKQMEEIWDLKKNSPSSICFIFGVSKT